MVLFSGICFALLIKYRDVLDRRDMSEWFFSSYIHSRVAFRRLFVWINILKWRIWFWILDVISFEGRVSVEETVRKIALFIDTDKQLSCWVSY